MATSMTWLKLMQRPLMRLAALSLVTFVATGCNALPFYESKSSRKVLPKSGLSQGTTFDQDELSPKEAAQACIVTALELEQAGHRPEAVAMYERARQHDPDQIDYSRRLAVLYDQLGNVTKARTEYQAAIEQSPKNSDLLNDFGYFHLRQGDLPAAESNFRKAIEQEPNHERAWTNLGIALAQLGSYNEAYEAFARVVGPAAAHSNVGAIMAKHGRVPQAKKAFQQALAINPNLQQPRAFLAHLAQNQH